MRFFLPLFVFVVLAGAGESVFAVEVFPTCGGTFSWGGATPARVHCSQAWVFVESGDLVSGDGVPLCGAVSSSADASGLNWLLSSGASVLHCATANNSSGSTVGASVLNIIGGCSGVASSTNLGGVYTAVCTFSAGGGGRVVGVAGLRPDLFDLGGGGESFGEDVMGMTSNELLGVLFVGLLVVVYIIGLIAGRQR